jgi:hypothetical protein
VALGSLVEDIQIGDYAGVKVCMTLHPSNTPTQQ